MGAFLPIPFYLYQRHCRLRHSHQSSTSSSSVASVHSHWTSHISTPVILNGVSYIPPATGINYSSWFLIGFIFQYWIRKRVGGRGYVWWVKYAYVLSSALDSGTVMGVMVVFLGLQMAGGGAGTTGGGGLRWWGNEVHMATVDWRRRALRAIPDGGLPWAELMPTPTAIP